MSQVLRDVFVTGCFGKSYSLIVFHSYLFCFLLLISFWIQRAYIKHQCLKFPDFCRDIQRHIWIRKLWWPGCPHDRWAREGSVGWVDIAVAQVHHPRVVFLSWKPAQNGAGPSSRASHSHGKGLAHPELWQEQQLLGMAVPPILISCAPRSCSGSSNHGAWSWNEGWEPSWQEGSSCSRLQGHFHILAPQMFLLSEMALQQTSEVHPPHCSPTGKAQGSLLNLCPDFSLCFKHRP